MFSISFTKFHDHQNVRLLAHTIIMSAVHASSVFL